MSLSDATQLLEADRRYVLVTTLFDNSVKYISYEIVPDTKANIAAAWNRACSSERLFGLRVLDTEDKRE